MYLFTPDVSWVDFDSLFEPDPLNDRGDASNMDEIPKQKIKTSRVSLLVLISLKALKSTFQI